MIGLAPNAAAAAAAAAADAGGGGTTPAGKPPWLPGGNVGRLGSAGRGKDGMDGCPKKFPAVPKSAVKGNGGRANPKPPGAVGRGGPIVIVIVIPPE